MEFSGPEYWSRQLFPSLGHFPNPGVEPRSTTLQVDSLPAEPPGKPSKSFWTPKKITDNANRQHAESEKIFASDMTNEGLISKMYKQLIQFNIKRNPM